MIIKKGILTTGVVMASMFTLSAYAEGPKLDVTGLVEVEFGHASENDGTDTSKSSGVSLATVELGFDVTVNEKVSAHILLLHEEDGTDPLAEVDEGIITIGDKDALSFSFGQMYVPFGVFESNVVSDPLTLEIAETRESAMMVNYVTGNIHAAFYLFNGTPVETSSTEDKLEQKGFSLGYATDNIDVGLDYISSLADSDGLQDLVNVVGPDSVLDSYVAGIAVHAIYRQDNFNVIFEHVKAQDSFAINDFGNAAEIQPSATNVEVGYSMGEHNFGISVQSTKEAAIFELPEKGLLLAYSRAIYENTTMSFEYAKYDHYSTSDGGDDGDDKVFTAQIAVEF